MHVTFFAPFAKVFRATTVLRIRSCYRLHYPRRFAWRDLKKHQPEHPFRVHDLNANDFLGPIAGIAEASLTIPLEQK